MSVSLLLTATAEAELLQAKDWYENKRQGLGDDFLTVFDETLNSISDNPLAFQCVHRDVRRALMPRFPYGVYFRAESEYILVLAVFHSSRNPAGWKRRST